MDETGRCDGNGGDEVRPGRDDALVVIGGGAAGASAVAAARAAGLTGRIRLITEEPELPYERPPLSKPVDAASPAGPVPRVPVLPHDFWTKHDVDVLLETSVTELDRSGTVVTASLITGSGAHRIPGTIRARTVLLATGGAPRRLGAPGGHDDRIHHLRTAVDADRLQADLAGAGELVVVGAGVIGLEVAAMARARGVGVTVVEAAPDALGRLGWPPVRDFLTEVHRRRGVRFHFGADVRAVRYAGTTVAVDLAESTVEGDLLVVGIGLQLNTRLAEQAGLRVDGGIVVDRSCRTSDERILAAGDVAVFPDRHTGELTRREQWQHALEQGAVAGRVAAGVDEQYDRPGWFWTDQYEFNVQVMGRPGPVGPPVVRGDPGSDGPWAVFHLDREQRLLGAATVNAPAVMRAGQGLAEASVPVDARDLADPGVDLRRLLRTARAAR